MIFTFKSFTNENFATCKFLTGRPMYGDVCVFIGVCVCTFFLDWSFDSCVFIFNFVALSFYSRWKSARSISQLAQPTISLLSCFHIDCVTCSWQQIKYDMAWYNRKSFLGPRKYILSENMLYEADIMAYRRLRLNVHQKCIVQNAEAEEDCCLKQEGHTAAHRSTRQIAMHEVQLFE